jgi:hypothetical protein
MFTPTVSMAICRYSVEVVPSPAGQQALLQEEGRLAAGFRPKQRYPPPHGEGNAAAVDEVADGVVFLLRLVGLCSQGVDLSLILSGLSR